MSDAAAEDTCPSEDDIAAFLRGGMAAPWMRALEAHVAQCAACRRLLSALARAATQDAPLSTDSVSPTLSVGPAGGETALRLHARFGRYVVLDWLGAGGMGVVYAAYDPELDRKVALKVLRNDDTGHADRVPSRDLLLREAQAMAQLAHPNVVTVFDVGSVGDRVFIAMELVDGETLSKWLRARPRTRSEILAMFLAAGNGLAAAHAAGLVHRDFKPDNVLVGKDGRVRVTDFGLARTAPRAALDAAAGGAPQTGLAGTLAYMAPEQYLRQSADARADQYSFAVALYEALYGGRPFPSARRFADGAAASQATVTVPPGSGVPVALRQAILRALSREPAQRYASMTELLAELAPRPRRTRAIALAAVVAVVVAVLAAGGYAIHLRRAAEQRIELVSRLRSVAPELRTVLRSAKMLPLHDIRLARDAVRAAMRDVERHLQTPAGQDERAVIAFVLGEGHRALGDHARALTSLEAAWAAGERGGQLDAALGYTLGASYWSRLQQIESTVAADQRAVEIQAIEQRYRDPAMAHLRAALAARASSPTYLEALIAFHEHRFADASRGAQAAFAESPTFYEAGVLEAKAHDEAGRALLAGDRRAAAEQEFLAARHIFERVLQIARSDDEAWLGYGEMVYTQAHDLASGELPTDLRQQAITAFRTVRQINPERWEAILSEAAIYEHEANLAIVWYRDPRPHVDKVLAAANEARAHGAASERVDLTVCRAYWERAAYESTHGIDPRPAFEQAAAACARATEAKPDADNYASLAVVYVTLATYNADHGGDPERFFELGARNFRAALGIREDAAQRYNLGRLWSGLAHYHSNHGRDPERAVAAALTELNTAVRLDATRSDALAAIGDVLIARARFQQSTQRDAQATITEARGALDRALAIAPELVPPVKYRIELAELDAEALLARGLDAEAAVKAMQADARLLLRRRPNDGAAHLMLCRAELLAARGALARGQAVDGFLTRAASEAARARKSDPTDAVAWTASAEVEQWRAQAARDRPAPRAAAIARGRAFLDQAMKIDPRLVRALKVRDELAR
jgi:tetratricopeptide (TPR) repeat protein